jgi:hypothetical protein
MRLKDKFDEALDLDTDNLIKIECEMIADEYLMEFLDWLHKGQTYAVNKNDIIKLFKEDYEERNN